MKRWLIYLMLLLLPCAALCEEPAPYDVLSEKALPLAESETFDACYRVVEADGQLFLELSLDNKTDKALKNVQFEFYPCRALAAALQNTQWYNEKQTLKTGDETPRCIIYTWSPAFTRPNLLSLDCLYDMIFEITWRGGSEILRVSPADREAPWLPEEETAVTLLTEEGLAQIKKAL